MHDSLLADADPVRHYRGEPFRADHTIRSSIPSYLSHAAELRGESLYLTAVAEDGSTTNVTYQELDEYSRRTAHWLRTECAVPPVLRWACCPSTTPSPWSDSSPCCARETRR